MCPLLGCAVLHSPIVLLLKHLFKDHAYPGRVFVKVDTQPELTSLSKTLGVNTKTPKVESPLLVAEPSSLPHTSTLIHIVLSPYCQSFCQLNRLLLQSPYQIPARPGSFSKILKSYGQKHALHPLDACKVTYPSLLFPVPILHSLTVYLHPWPPGTNLTYAFARLLSTVSSSVLNIGILNKYNRGRELMSLFV